jgi:hypothetical protein
MNLRHLYAVIIVYLFPIGYLAVSTIVIFVLGDEVAVAQISCLSLTCWLIATETVTFFLRKRLLVAKQTPLGIWVA